VSRVTYPAETSRSLARTPIKSGVQNSDLPIHPLARLEEKIQKINTRED
jgi:hypothetical protein